MNSIIRLTGHITSSNILVQIFFELLLAAVFDCAGDLIKLPVNKLFPKSLRDEIIPLHLRSDQLQFINFLFFDGIV